MARTKQKHKEPTEAEIQENTTAWSTFREQVANGMRILPQEPRKLYVADRKFLVMRHGARFEGIVQFGEKQWAGWSRKLVPGEIITCEGWKPGMSTEQEGVNWTAKRVPENVLWCQVWPINGLFTPWPLPGFLRALPDEED